VKNGKNENKNENESEEISANLYSIFIFSPAIFPFSGVSGSAGGGCGEESGDKMRFHGSDDRSRGYRHF